MLSRDYIAGFFDGEGTVGIYSGGRRGPGRPYTVLSMRFTNNDRDVIDEIAETIQAKLRVPNPRYRTMKHPDERRRHDNYVLDYKGRRAAEILRWLAPSLRTKRPQADIAVRYQRHKTHIGGRPPEPDRAAYFDFEESCRLDMLQATRRFHGALN